MTDPNDHPDPPSEISPKTRLWQPGEPESRQVGDTASKQAELAPEASAGHPGRIGRYRIERVLGQGGFGLVYLAHDEQLQRFVAIKVPHRKLVDHPEDAEAYLTEARILQPTERKSNEGIVHHALSNVVAQYQHQLCPNQDRLGRSEARRER